MPSDDLIMQGLMDRVFGGVDPVPTQDPSAGQYDELRNQSQAGGSIPNEPLPLVGQADVDRAKEIVRQIAGLFQRSNITASLPAHVEPTPFSIPLDLSTTITLPAAASPVWTPMLTYKSPPGRYARIAGYGVDVDGSFTYDGSILFRLLKNGADPGGLTDWGEHRGSVIRPRWTFIILPEDQVITLQCRRAVAAGAPSRVSAALVGWSWLLSNNWQGTQASIATF
jgi:hypothetical protein